MSAEDARPSPPVLIVDTDPLVAAVAARALKGAGHTAIIAPDAQSLRAAGASHSGPRILVVDWTQCQGAAQEVCHELRAQAPLHVIAAIAGGRPKDSLAALQAGADECMAKPISPHELVARVGWAKRMFASTPAISMGLRAALRHAARAGSGEVVISKDTTVGRIFFDAGQVVWAKLSDRPLSLRAILEGNATLEPHEVNEVVEESRRTGRNFLEVLSEWGLVSRAEVAAAVRRYIAETVRAMLQMQGAQVVFAPAMRPGTWTGPRFSLAEIVPPETRRDLPALRVIQQPELTEQRRCQFADKCTACDRFGASLPTDLRTSGADAVAVVHGPSGETIVSAGDGIDPDIVRSKVRIMDILAQSDRADDIVVSAGAKYYLLASTPCPDAYLVMTATRKKMGLGALKHEINRLAGKIYPDEETSSRRSERMRANSAPASGPSLPDSAPPPTTKSAAGEDE